MVLGVSLSSFAQDASKIALSEGTTSLKSSMESNEFHFTLPNKMTKAEVEKSASYYTSDITVVFDETKNAVTITVVGTQKKSKYIIARFLTACGASFIKVDDKNLEMSEFIKAYLN